MNIIERRLLKATAVNSDSANPAKRARRQAVKTRRGPYKKGVAVMTKHVSLDVPEALFARMARVCGAKRVAKAVLIREAIEFYVGMAEQEGLGL